MIYIYEENLPFYDELDNKSQWINDKLQDARINTRIKDETQVTTQVMSPQVATAPEIPDDDPDWHVDPRIRETRRQVREMEERDRNRRA